MTRRGVATACAVGAVVAVACVAPPVRYEPEGRPLGALDSSGWERLLRTHVRDGVVDYRGFDGAPDLDGWLAQVRGARITPATSRAERLAFWINAYNASAVAGILDGASPATLAGRYTFFLRIRYPVAGEWITLWDLEHERVRPLGEPRVHFALVCASSSCPELRSSVFTAAGLDAQLEQAARAFVNDPTRNEFDARARVARLSPVFDWYEEDFDRGVTAFVARYVDDPVVARDLAAGRYEVEYADYDWSLNGIPPDRCC